MFRPNASFVQSTYLVSSTKTLYYDKDHCLTFWYFDDGEDSFTLQVYMATPRVNVTLNQFSSAIESRRRWNLLKADIQLNPAYQTRCK